MRNPRHVLQSTQTPSPASPSRRAGGEKEEQSPKTGDSPEQPLPSCLFFVRVKHNQGTVAKKGLRKIKDKKDGATRSVCRAHLRHRGLRGDKGASGRANKQAGRRQTRIAPPKQTSQQAAASAAKDRSERRVATPTTTGPKMTHDLAHHQARADKPSASSSPDACMTGSTPAAIFVQTRRRSCVQHAAAEARDTFSGP